MVWTIIPMHLATCVPVNGKQEIFRAYDQDGGINLYQYVENNPVNAVDPDGRFAWFVAPIAGAIAGGIGGYLSDGNWQRGALLGALGGFMIAGGGLLTGAVTAGGGLSVAATGGLGGAAGETCMAGGGMANGVKEGTDFFNIAGYKFFGSTNLVDKDFVLNADTIYRIGPMNLRGLFDTLTEMAQKVNASRLVIKFNFVYNPGFFNEAVARRFGFQLIRTTERAMNECVSKVTLIKNFGP